MMRRMRRRTKRNMTYKKYKNKVAKIYKNGVCVFVCVVFCLNFKIIKRPLFFFVCGEKSVLIYIIKK